MKIDWDTLEMAFTVHDSTGVMGEAFLDLTTGKVVWVGGDSPDLEEDDEAFDETRLLAIPSMDTDDEIEWMHEFRRSVRDRALMQSLDQAFSGGKGFFRRFKDALARHGAVDRWHQLRQRKIDEMMVAWLRRLEIEHEDLPRSLMNAGVAVPGAALRAENDIEEPEMPIRATIHSVLDGGEIIRLGDAIEVLEATVDDAEFEYEVTVHVRASRPISKKARQALERRAIAVLTANPKFVEDEPKQGKPQE